MLSLDKSNRLATADKKGMPEICLTRCLAYHPGPYIANLLGMQSSGFLHEAGKPLPTLLALPYVIDTWRRIIIETVQFSMYFSMPLSGALSLLFKDSLLS